MFDFPFFGRDDANNNFLIKINVSNVYIEVDDVQGITMDDVNLNSYIDNLENIISLVNDGDLIYIVSYIFDNNNVNYTINLNVYNIQTEEIKPIQLENNIITYYPSKCIIYNSLILSIFKSDIH